MKAAFLLALAAIAFAQQPTDKGVNFYSYEKETALGNQLAENLRQSVATTADPRLDRIGARLVPKTTKWQYRLWVMEGGEDEVEPVALPGGIIFVPRHLMAFDDAQMAAVLAHAIGHVELRHRTRAMTRGELAAIGNQTALAAAHTPLARPSMIPAGFLQMQRRFELDADAYAVTLLKDTGYDPQTLLQYLRTLPAAEARVAAVEKEIEAGK